MKLVWTQLATLDRKAIHEYVAMESPMAALALDARLAEKASHPLDHPRLGRPGRVAGTRERVAHANYIFVYDIVDGLVRILRVLHAARQWPPGN